MGFVRGYLMPHEVASMLAVSVSSIRRYCDEGQLTCTITPGGHRRVMGGPLLTRLGSSQNF